MDMQNTTVVVTGAAGNLGRAVASALAQRGANLVLLDLQRESLQKSYGEETAQQMLVPVNLLEQEQVQAAVDAAVARFGRIDVLCNLAGGFRMGEAVHTTQDTTWDWLMDLNARTLLHMARAVVPHMLAKGGGKIVNVSAASAQRGVAQMGAYCASKSSVVRLTEAMAGELREQNTKLRLDRFGPEGPIDSGAWHRVISTEEQRIVWPGQGVLLGLRQVALIEDEGGHHWRVVVAHEKGKRPFIEAKELAAESQTAK